MSFNVLNIVELRCQGIVDVDTNNFPIGFLFIKKSHDAEYLDLFDLSSKTDSFTNLYHVQWVVIPFCFRFGVDDVRILPGLGKGSIVPDIAT